MTRSVIDDQRSAAMQLNVEELQRYSRHLIMPEVTAEGQNRLKAARVLCIGAGGLGSPAALYLAAAGVGTIGIVDFDDVDLSNLQRQILHGTKDVGRGKLESACDRLHDINPQIELELHKCRFSSDNAAELVTGYDVIVDGSDNFPTRYLSNDVCVFGRKPNIYGSVFRFEGQTTVFAPHLGGPCYRCLFPEPPPPESVPNCAQAGVLGVLPGIIGMLQAIEALKLILGIGESLVGRLLHFDALRVKFRELNLRRDPQCPVCGENPSIFSPIDYEEFCGLHAEGTIPEMSPHELKQWTEAGETFDLIDVREPFEYEIARIDGSKLIPLGEITERLGELERDRPIVVHCHSGMRSAQAVRLLQQRGFTKVYNLEGGIEAWSDQIDPDVPKY
ncbi:MAG TPA: molybdopterin-synthase adenylyltransferase MoeB [Candidatus Udaeobacter sp.]|jgi:adenylyltransferase/sulfurtransferase|nr:molybdopterin-synthase adenylyltransferase MoeB [Candidatus Udaeobacter sp.]